MHSKQPRKRPREPLLGFQVSPAVQRLSGAGFELAGASLVLGGLGFLVDRQGSWEQPWLGIAGVLLGFALGMFRLIRVAGELESLEKLRESRESMTSRATPLAGEKLNDGAYAVARKGKEEGEAPKADHE